MNDPEYFERRRYTDSIDAYNNIIEEFEKQYEQTPTTQQYARATILSGMKKSKRDFKNSG
jgi:lipopolysaccharide biosynthesis protein